MAEQSTVQSLDRAFDLLETLCRSRNGMSIGGLSAETGLHKSTVHRLLTSMCARRGNQRLPRRYAPVRVEQLYCG